MIRFGFESSSIVIKSSLLYLQQSLSFDLFSEYKIKITRICQESWLKICSWITRWIRIDRPDKRSYAVIWIHSGLKSQNALSSNMDSTLEAVSLQVAENVMASHVVTFGNMKILLILIVPLRWIKMQLMHLTMSSWKLRLRTLAIFMIKLRLVFEFSTDDWYNSYH